MVKSPKNEPLETAFYFQPFMVFQELLGKYASLLPEEAKREFESLSVFDLIRAIPQDIVASSWYKQFREEWNTHYSSGNAVVAIEHS